MECYNEQNSSVVTERELVSSNKGRALVVATPCPGCPGQRHRRGHGSSPSAQLTFHVSPVQVGTAAAHSCYLCRTIISIIFLCCWNRSCLPISLFPGVMHNGD